MINLILILFLFYLPCGFLAYFAAMSNFGPPKISPYMKFNSVTKEQYIAKTISENKAISRHLGYRGPLGLIILILMINND